MTSVNSLGALAAACTVLLCACATSGGARSAPPAKPAERHAATEPLPDITAFEAGPPRAAYYDARLAEGRGDARAAADQYLAFARDFPETGWALPLRYHSAELYLRGGDAAHAANVAAQLAEAPGADLRSRAAARLLEANARVKAGELEALRVVPVDDRKGAAPRPRPPPGAWKEFVDATQAYLASPEAARAASEASRLSAPALAVTAAEVEFACDDFAAARRLSREVIERWPGDGAAFAKAAPLYLETFRAASDDAGYASALSRVADEAAALHDRAPAADATAYARVLDDVQRAQARLRYREAKDLLEQGRAAEAAKAYEALVTAPASDPAVALNDAAFAWQRAGNAARASELRARLVAEHPDAPVALGAELALAAARSEAGDHAAAAQLYRKAADASHDAETRCLALRNGAIELDRADRPVDAAEQYTAFGRDPACSRGAPDAAATALYRAGVLFRGAKRGDDAIEAFRAVTAVKGVVGSDGRRVVDAAQRELRRR